MRYHTPKLAYYGQTFDQAIEIICRRKLQACEADSQPVYGILFQSYSDLFACALVFNDSIEIEGSLVIIPAALKSEVKDLIEQMSMEDRVEWVELLGMWFWNSDDEFAFNQELDAL